MEGEKRRERVPCLCLFLKQNFAVRDRTASPCSTVAFPVAVFVGPPWQEGVLSWLKKRNK